MGSADGSLTFSWVDGLLKKALESGTLQFTDIARYGQDIRPMWYALCYTSEPAPRTGVRLLGTMMAPVKRKYFALLLCKVLDDALSFAAPLILGDLVELVSTESPEAEQWRNLSSLLKAIVTTQYTYHLNLMAIRAHGSLMQAPLCAALHMPAYVRGRFSEGHCQSLISVDARKVSDFFCSSHSLVTLPLQIVLALVILWRQVRMAFVAGLLLVIALIPINRLLAWGITTASQRMLAHKDRRLGIMTTLLSNLRSLFMMGWHDVMRMQARKHRRKELGMLAVRKYLDAVCVCAWALTSSLFAVTTFGLMAWWGQPLQPATVIVCLTLFNILIAPLNALPWVLNGVLEALVSARRLAAFLGAAGTTPAAPGALLRDNPTAVSRTRIQAGDAPEPAEAAPFPSFGWDAVIEEVHSSPPAGQAAPLADRSVPAAEPAVQMKRASFAWRADPGAPARPVLRDLCFSVPKGCFCVLVGPSGSGKSSVLSAVLGDMLLTGGTCEACGTCALAPQEPWLIADTIRDNIIMGSRVDEQRYHMVLEACELIPDIQSMPSGDATRVTDCGDNMSGGQRARLSLARTLYARSDVYLLDDCLAALDGKVACCVLRSLLYSPLMSHATVIMASSHQPSITAADFVISMEHGSVASVVGQAGRTAMAAAAEAIAGGQLTASPSKRRTALGRPRSGGSRSFESSLPQFLLEDAWDQCMSTRDQWESRIAAGDTPPWPLSLQPCLNEEDCGADVHQAPQADESAVSGAEAGRHETASAGVEENGKRAQGVSAPQAEYAQSPSPTGALTWQHVQLRPHPSYGPHSPLPFFTVPDSPRGSADPSAAPAQLYSSLGVANVAANDSARDHYMEAGFASGRYSMQSFMHPPQYTPDLQTGYAGALSYVSTPRSHTLSAGTRHSASLARASTSDMANLLPRGHRRPGDSSSEFASVSAPASPSHLAQPFSGYPQAWGNMRARVGSGSSLSDLPLSVRAGGSSSLRTVGGGGSRGRFLSSQGDATDSHLPGSESMCALDSLPLQNEATAREEGREVGHVKLAIYWELLSAVGWAAAIAVVVALVAMQLSRTLTDVYVTLWSGNVGTGHPQPHSALLRHDWTSESTAVFLRGLGVLTLVALVATIARAFLFAGAGLKAADKLHTRLMDSVLAADLSVLSRVPHGRLLARVSTDTEAIDDQLPFIANIALASIAGFSAALLLMLVSQPLLLVAVAALAVLYLRLQRWYRAGGREIRRLENASTAPVYSVFAEAVSGAAAARSLGLAGHLQQRMSGAVSVHLAARVASNALDQWLALRLQLASAAVVGVLAFLAVTSQVVEAPGLSGSQWPMLLTGLSLAYALPMVSLLSSLLTSCAEVEQEMVAVERVVQFTHLPRSTAAQQDGHAELDPGDSSLTFDSVCLTYPGRRVPALDYVSFTVPAGWHFGICGRTGAGKSSILTALFQLSPLQRGSIRIGSIDLAGVSAGSLQSLLAVVPQKPVILHGSIADNLDPLGRHAPEELLAVLHDVRLLPVLTVKAQEQLGRTSAGSHGEPGTSTCNTPNICQAQDLHSTANFAAPWDGDMQEPLLSANRTVAHNGQLYGRHHDMLGVQLGENGAVLSVGQQQLLSMARALLRNPTIVCLDELSANLSAAESTIIETVVSERLKHRTCIRISHNVDILMACDIVGILERGQLMEMGSPGDLSSKLLNVHYVNHPHDTNSDSTV